MQLRILGLAAILLSAVAAQDGNSIDSALDSGASSVALPSVSALPAGSAQAVGGTLNKAIPTGRKRFRAKKKAKSESIRLWSLLQ